jgi:hypothetical protein
MRQPFPNRDEHARLQAVETAPTRQVEPPAYGQPEREAIHAMVDNLTRDVIDHIGSLRKQLDGLENQVLVGSAAAKDILLSQVAVSQRVSSEATRIGEAIAEIGQKVIRQL